MSEKDLIQVGVQESYHSNIEEEEDDFEIEESDEEVITLDFDNNLAYEQEIIIGENVVTDWKELGKQNIHEGEMAPVQAPVAPPVRTYKEDVADLFVNTLTSKAIASLITQHRDLEKTLSDEVSKKHAKKMGATFNTHENVICKSIDGKVSELRRAYGFTGRVDYNLIPDWSKGYIEDYIKNFISELCTFTEDV